MQGEIVVRAAAAAAAANSGPIVVPSVLLGYVSYLASRGEGFSTSPSPARRRLTVCVIAGCVGHASVHCDSGPRAWGSGERARCVFTGAAAPVLVHGT